MKKQNNTKCDGPCSAKTDEEVRTKIFNPDCPDCMRVWNDFILKNNIFVSTDKK